LKLTLEQINEVATLTQLRETDTLKNKAGRNLKSECRMGGAAFCDTHHLHAPMMGIAKKPLQPSYESRKLGVQCEREVFS
jgi:hypothetical protein